MAKKLGWASLLIALTCSTTSSALEDGYWARRSDEMKEHSHTGTLTMAPGHAKIVVRRTVDNQGVRNDEANFDIRIPSGAVAVGLRTLALKDGAPHWYRGDLMEAEAAAAKYLELTGIGGAYPKDPALLSWRSSGHLRLQVFPCPPKAKKSVEYTLLLPTEYTGGKHVVTLPRMGSKEVAADFRLGAMHHKIAVDGKRARAGHRLEVGKSGDVEVSLTPSHMARLGGGLASVPAGKRFLNRLHLEAAPKLSRVPRGAKVVIVIDRSRSWSKSEVEASRSAAISYLEHFPGARVEVLSFAREVTRQHGRFVSPKKAIAQLKKADFTRKNGSFVDEALQQAEKLLAKHKGPKRIVLFTDTETRMAVDATQIRAMMSGDALLHIVKPHSSNDSSLIRDDDHHWADISTSTGGLFWRAGVSGDAKPFEELVRPIRIHNFAMAGKGISIDDCVLSAELLEGEGVECSHVSDKTASWFSASGELWTKPIRVRVRPSKTETNLWAALAFGSGDWSDLTDEEMMPVALRGKAVSPVTSYLAIEPGVRPSRDGLAHGRLGRSRRARPPRVRMGATSVSGKKPEFDGQAYLTHAFAGSWLKCGGAGKDASVRLETNYREIIDVYTVSSDTGSAKQVACLKAAVWGELLPTPFDQHQTIWDITI